MCEGLRTQEDSENDDRVEAFLNHFRIIAGDKVKGGTLGSSESEDDGLVDIWNFLFALLHREFSPALSSS